MPIHVNLIPVNEVAETGFTRAGDAAVAAFARTLEAHGIRATAPPCGRRRGAGRKLICTALRPTDGGAVCTPW